MTRAILGTCLFAACDLLAYDLTPPSGNDPATDAGAADRVQVIDAQACPTNLLSNPEHCGVCGHSCVGGDCVSGVCQPLRLYADLPNVAEYVRDVVVTGDVVFVATTHALVRLPSRGGPETSYASMTTEAVATDGVAVVYATGPTIYAATVASPSSTIVLSGVWASELEISGGTVVYLNSDGTIGAVGLDGTAARTLATGQVSARSLAVSGEDVAWVAGTTIMTVRLDGTGLRAAATGLYDPWGLVLDGDRFAVAERTNYRIVEGSLSTSGAVTTLVAGEPRPMALARDATGLFWSRDNSGVSPFTVPDDIRGLPTGTSAVVPVAARNLVAITLDADAVYWISESGGAWKVAKPPAFAGP